MKTSLIQLILFVFIITDLAHAQTSLNSNITGSVKAYRFQGGITFDRIPDEDAWKQAEAFPLVMCLPKPGSEPTEVSIVKIGYNDEYLYFSGLIPARVTTSGLYMMRDLIPIPAG